MKYELAKKLKDAGFPQNPDDLELHTPDCKGWEGPSDCTKKTRARVPTLSKLIQACQPHFDSLICIPGIRKSDFSGNLGKVIQKGGWKALSNTEVGATGETPDEAIANLWLAIQEAPASVLILRQAPMKET